MAPATAHERGLIVLRGSLPTLGRILEWMAQLSAPHHRDLIQGMVSELDSIADPAERRWFAIGAIAAICRLCFLSGDISILIADKYLPFLKAAEIPRHLSISRKIWFLSGLGMFLGWIILDLDLHYEALFSVFMLGGAGLGIVGLFYDLFADRCPSCDTSLTWHAYSQLPVGESESWLRRFEECPHCHLQLVTDMGSKAAPAGQLTAEKPALSAWLSLALIILGSILLGIQVFIILVYHGLVSEIGIHALPTQSLTLGAVAWAAAHFARSGIYPTAAYYLGKTVVVFLSLGLLARLLW